MLQKGELKMIKEMIEEGMSKSAIARKLGISRETMRRYAKKHEEYIPVIEKEPVETSIDEYLPDILPSLHT